jgi:uncharacterized protein (DUF1501 family)
MPSPSFLIARRRLLQGAAATGLLAAAPGLLLAQAATRRRFVFVIQRGGADGLETVVPFADPAYARLRGAIAHDPAALSRLDGLFGLHPALVETARMHAAREALFVHAVASPYRERSHFDGQNVLETGGAAPYARKDGWLNRLVGLLPGGGEAIAITPTVPLALRGPAKAGSHAPSALPQAPDDLMQSVRQLYAQDAQLSALWSAAMESRGMAGAPVKQNPAELGALAARFLAQPAGPRIAMLETGGWDTHSFQPQRHANQLKALDAMLAALREGMGAAWADTVVLVATEFGRTAAVNGTGGTDHGTGSVAMLLGGAVEGGRVLGDWPGLEPQALYQGRDLQPTTGLDGLIAQAAGECFGIEPQRLAQELFSRGDARTPLPRLLRG